MKVLIYSRAFAPLIGGVETYAMFLARGLARGSDAAQPDAIQVTVATEAIARGFDDSSLPFHIVRRPGLRALFRLIQEVSIVQVAGPCLLPMLLAWLLRKPFVVEQHGYQSVCPNGLLFFEPTKAVCPGHFMAKRHAKCWECNQGVGTLQSLKMWLLTFFRRWLCNQATANVAVSYHVQERIQLRNSLVIYHGIPDAMQQIKSPTSNDKLSSPPCFAYVGRLVSEKGLDVLLDAAAMLKQEGLDFRLKFIGDGPERQHLESRVAEQHLDDQVTFTGFLTGEPLSQAVSDIAVIIMPSRCEETAGLSAIEQMMRGRLVICSNIGGLGEVVDGAGLKFAPENASALAASMRQVVGKPQIVEEFGKKARERALRLFAMDRMIREHVELYSGVIGRKLARRESAPELQ
ncbi:MAG: glycosyltransferase family 4 protein [Candidatus Acidiferrales bacterium]